jgi:hypothetical protein
MPAAYSESSWAVAFIRFRNDFIGNEFAALGLRKTLADRSLGLGVERESRCVRFRHRKQNAGERVLLRLWQFPHLRDDQSSSLASVARIERSEIRDQTFHK